MSLLEASLDIGQRTTSSYGQPYWPAKVVLSYQTKDHLRNLVDRLNKKTKALAIRRRLSGYKGGLILLRIYSLVKFILIAMCKQKYMELRMF